MWLESLAIFIFISWSNISSEKDNIWCGSYSLVQIQIKAFFSSSYCLLLSAPKITPRFQKFSTNVLQKSFFSRSFMSSSLNDAISSPCYYLCAWVFHQLQKAVTVHFNYRGLVYSQFLSWFSEEIFSSAALRAKLAIWRAANAKCTCDCPLKMSWNFPERLRLWKGKFFRPTMVGCQASQSHGVTQSHSLAWKLRR